MSDKTEIDDGAPARKSPQDARQGRPGRPVLYVLVAGTLLGLAALLIVYLSVDATV